MSIDTITRGSGNVFADLGLPEPEELSVKADLVRQFARVLKAKSLSQAKAAALCQTDQPMISKVLRGRLELVTVERLRKWLMVLNQEVRS
jgi:predicted XRE-type DNA-binding protein